MNVIVKLLYNTGPWVTLCTLSPHVLIDKQQKTPAAPPPLLSASVVKDTKQSQSGKMPEPKQK